MSLVKKLPYEIKIAFLHQAITWPGVTGGEKTMSEARIPGLKMRMIDIQTDDGQVLRGLLCKAICKAQEKTTIILEPNISNLILE